VIVGIINGMCVDLIDRAKTRYAASVINGHKGGRPKKYDTAQIITLHNQGLSNQEIADSLGCNLRTVQRTLNDKEAHE
jgi:hypothetical protein